MTMFGYAEKALAWLDTQVWDGLLKLLGIRPREDREAAERRLADLELSRWADDGGPCPSTD